MYRLRGVSDPVVGLSYAQILWRLWLNAEMVGRFEVCVLGFLNSRVLYALVIIWLYALMIKCMYSPCLNAIYKLHVTHKIYFWITCEHTWLTIYVYAWRSKRLSSWMLRHIHALRRLVKSKSNWTVRCMCTLRFKCSCACMFTSFVDLVLTCLLA